MKANIHDKKIRRQKRCKNSAEIAYVCGCNVRMVNYVLSGGRGSKRATALAEKIQLAVMLLDDKGKMAAEEVRKLLEAPTA